jgi:hypothetical protein
MYCSDVWDPHQSYLQEKLEKVEKRAARFITSYYNYEPGIQQTLAPDIECNTADKMMKPSTNTGNEKQSRKDYKHQKRLNSRTPECILHAYLVCIMTI